MVSTRCPGRSGTLPFGMEQMRRLFWSAWVRFNEANIAIGSHEARKAIAALLQEPEHGQTADG
jgi:hypothetical protein